MSHSLHHLVARRRAWRAIRRHVIAACEADPKLHALLYRIACWAHPTWRLRELLWMAFATDFEAYARLGRPISNRVWVKSELCPLPMPLAAPPEKA